jgi:hypothetical protein
LKNALIAFFEDFGLVKEKFLLKRFVLVSDDDDDD